MRLSLLKLLYRSLLTVFFGYSENGIFDDVKITSALRHDMHMYVDIFFSSFQWANAIPSLQLGTGKTAGCPVGW